MSDKKRKFQFIEGKEPFFVFGGLALAFIILLVLIYLIYSNMIDKIQLELKFDSEKSFNSVYLSLSDSTEQALRTMKEEGVTGVAIYGTSGHFYQGLGDSPKILPIEKLLEARNKGEDSTLGIFVFDAESKTIEYFRLSRLNIVFETGTLQIPAVSKYSSPEFPEVLYVKFKADKYYDKVRNTRLFFEFGILVIVFVFLLVVNIYRSNRKYKKQLVKNESLANLGAAARTLTHEIKNPLSAMTIQSALLKKELPAQFTSDLEIMDQEITRLTNLTNRVSEFLKNPVGNPERIELVSFITSIAGLFVNHISLNFNGIQSLYVMFDSSRARSIIENLIKNASESCSDRDPNVEVSMRKLKNKKVRIRIMDRGDGLPENIGNKVFDPFFTTKIHGSGIGLSISKQFIEARGGSLRLYPRDGGGTIAEIVLKLEEGV